MFCILGQGGEGYERSKCPKFSLDDQWECIHDTFQYIHEEIIALKYDFEKLLDYLDDEWDLIN